MEEDRCQRIDESVVFDCRCCGACCSAPWRITLKGEQINRIQTHDWSKYPAFAGKTFFYPAADGQPDRYDLAKNEAGRCLFLDTDRLCIIHKELGPEAKPFMCRQFPYLLTRTWTDDRVSVSYGCPAVQGREGTPLPKHKESIQALIPISKSPCRPEAPWAFDSKIRITPPEAEAFFDRAVRIFGDDREESLWTRFAELLTVLEAVREFKEPARNEPGVMIDFLKSETVRPEGSATAEVQGYENPSLAPLGSRFLFAATLFPDTLTRDSRSSGGLFQRLRRIPKLLALAGLAGEYSSLFLGRRINVTDLMEAQMAPAIPDSARGLLLRYFRSRFWQRFPSGTHLTIVSGIHQHIHDFNAVLFFARALYLGRGDTAISNEDIGAALQIVEFHLANQIRLYTHTLKGYLKSALDSLPLAAASLRLMAPKHPAPVLETVG